MTPMQVTASGFAVEADRYPYGQGGIGTFPLSNQFDTLHSDAQKELSCFAAPISPIAARADSMSLIRFFDKLTSSPLVLPSNKKIPKCFIRINLAHLPLFASAMKFLKSAYSRNSSCLSTSPATSSVLTAR